MRAIITHMVRRDIDLAIRGGQNLWLGVVFFTIFLTLSVISLGGNAQYGGHSALAHLAPALIWLATILSALLSFTQIFTDDYADGTLEQLALAGIPYLNICLSKTLSFSLIALIPLWLATPIAALAFSLSHDVILRLMVSILTAIPAIAAYAIFSSALTITRRANGLFIVLITVPFLIPILIFGVTATQAQDFNTSIRALLGLSLIACAIGLPASAFALKTAYE